MVHNTLLRLALCIPAAFVSSLALGACDIDLGDLETGDDEEEDDGEDEGEDGEEESEGEADSDDTKGAISEGEGDEGNDDGGKTDGGMEDDSSDDDSAGYDDTGGEDSGYEETGYDDSGYDDSGYDDTGVGEGDEVAACAAYCNVELSCYGESESLDQCVADCLIDHGDASLYGCGETQIQMNLCFGQLDCASADLVSNAFAEIDLYGEALSPFPCENEVYTAVWCLLENGGDA